MYSWKDRLRDFLGMDRSAGVRMAMAIVIAVIIAAVIVTQVGVTQSAYNEEMAQMAQSIATQGSEITDNAVDIRDLNDDIGAMNTQYGGLTDTVALHTDNLSSHDNRLGTLEGNVTTLEGMVNNLTVPNSPPEAYLTGNLTSGNLTIHAEASESGNYTANVHLVFASAAVNWTDTVTWNATNSRAYVPVTTYNGTDWLTTGTWWNVGTFELAADTEKAINVLFGGLADTVSFAYVEIYPVLQ